MLGLGLVPTCVCSSLLKANLKTKWRIADQQQRIQRANLAWPLSTSLTPQSQLLLRRQIHLKLVTGEDHWLCYPADFETSESKNLKNHHQSAGKSNGRTDWKPSTVRQRTLDQHGKGENFQQIFFSTTYSPKIAIVKKTSKEQKKMDFFSKHQKLVNYVFLH